MKFIVSLAVVALVLSGCDTRTTYNNFKSSEIKENDRTVFGKINITYRGLQFDRPCRLFFNSKTTRPYLIGQSSILLTTLPTGENHITALQCSIGPKTIWKFENFAFNVGEKTSATDIGNINIELGDKELHDKAITNAGIDFIDSIGLSLISQKYKDAFDINISYKKLSNDERKEIFIEYPELNKASNGKYIQAVKPAIDSIQVEGTLPKAYKPRIKN